MKGTVLLVAFSLAYFATACASSVDVAFEDRRTLSRYSTWDWRADATSQVEANPADAAALQSHVGRLIEQALRGRGFERDRHNADIFLTYQVAHRLLVEIVDVPMAPYFLSSHHGSTSYWVEGTQKERRIFREVRLMLLVTQGDGRTLWQASLERRANESSAFPLAEVVGSLIERFPGSHPQVE